MFYKKLFKIAKNDWHKLNMLQIFSILTNICDTRKNPDVQYIQTGD